MCYLLFTLHIMAQQFLKGSANEQHERLDETTKHTLSVSENIADKVSALSETLPYFDLAGHHLERQNHGSPKCPDIALNEGEASTTTPQAWLQEINGQECWFYNHP